MRVATARRAPSRAPGTVLCALFALIAPASADEVALAPSRDTSLYSESNSLSNGEGIGLFAGRTRRGATRRALLAFDVGAAIPAGSLITAAQLGLRVTRTMAGAQTVTLHRILADWGEAGSNASGEEGTGAAAHTGDATWRYRFFDTDSWTTDGGDFVATPSASALAGTGASVTWASTAGMVADVQAWLENPTANFGWIVRGNESGNTTAERFASREHPTQALRPRLTISFEPPAAATATPTIAGAVATETPTAAPTGSPTPTSTVAASDTVLPTHTATATDTALPTRTATATATDTARATVTAAASDTPRPETPTATPTATGTLGPTRTSSTTRSATHAPEPTTPSTSTPQASAVPPLTATAARAATASPTATLDAPPFTPTPPMAACAGDCDGSRSVAINELITCVSIALGTLQPASCPACDASASGMVEISDLIAAVNSALSGCGTAPRRS